MAMQDDLEWGRIEQELRRQPGVDPAAVGRVMAEIRRPRPDPWHRRITAWLTQPRLTLSPAGALLGAAVIGAVALGVARSAIAPSESRTVASVPAIGEPGVASTSTPTTRVLGTTGTSARQNVQFVLVADSARDVRIVGDFNDWDPAATPMRRSATSGIWSVVVQLEPGRHVYAFVIDGKKWIADVTAPRAPDTEFGGPNSIIMVGGSS
jgi:hypothetical protein